VEHVHGIAPQIRSIFDQLQVYKLQKERLADLLQPTSKPPPF
jgi:hypothetical protein